MLKNKYVLIGWLVVFFAGFSFAASEGDLNKPDTVKVGCIPEVGPNQSFVIAVTAFTDELVGGISLPLIFSRDSKSGLFCDSIKWGKWILQTHPDIEATSIDTLNSKVRMGAVWFTKGLPPAKDTLAKIYFHTGPKWKKDKGVVIDTTACYPPPTGTRFHFVEKDKAKGFKPVFVKGCIGKVSK